MFSRFSLKEINSSTLPAVKNLLFQRNQTMSEYVEWKYGAESPKGFRGVVAFDGNQEVGCFGSVPLNAVTKSGEKIEIGWFADWYVSPSYRGHGMGQVLLNRLTEENLYFLGHPGPQYALNICNRAGWNQIIFQSKYRWVFHNRKYYRHRSKNWINSTIKSFISAVSQTYNQINANIASKICNPSSNQIELLVNDNLKNWFLTQPCVPEIHRNFGEWTAGNINILFSDQILLNSGEKYRKVLLISPLSDLSKDTLSQFLAVCKKENITYVEMLTGSLEFDRICRKLRGIRISESPIVYTGFINGLMIPNLQGVHRENWLFQAGRN